MPFAARDAAVTVVVQVREGVLAIVILLGVLAEKLAASKRSVAIVVRTGEAVLDRSAIPRGRCGRSCVIEAMESFGAPVVERILPLKALELLRLDSARAAAAPRAHFVTRQDAVVIPIVNLERPIVPRHSRRAMTPSLFVSIPANRIPLRSGGCAPAVPHDTGASRRRAP